MVAHPLIELQTPGALTERKRSPYTHTILADADFVEEVPFDRTDLSHVDLCLACGRPGLWLVSGPTRGMIPPTDLTGALPGNQLELEISSLAYGGGGVSRVHGLVVLVDRAVPGERVLAEITHRSKRFARGKILRILSPSPERGEAPCRHFRECGGCTYQALDYALQLRTKREQVKDLLERIGRIPNPVVLPTLGSDHPLRYRQRMSYEVAAAPEVGIGLHRLAEPESVLEVPDCLLPVEELRVAYRRILEDLRPLPGPARPHRVELHAGWGARACVALLRGAGSPSPTVRRLAEGWVAREGILQGVTWISEEGPGGIVEKGSPILLAGAGTVEEKLGEFLFRIPTGSFFQANPPLAAQVFEIMGAKCGPGEILELYAGVGALTLFLTKRGRRVVAVEGREESWRAASENARSNGVQGVEFLLLDVGEALHRWIRQGRRFETVVLDPPRTGLPHGGARRLARLAISRILYLSCDPATLARDLRELLETGDWKLKEVLPVDLFPQTAAIECLAELESAASRQAPRSRTSPA